MRGPNVSRTVLISVLGTSPQIVTETLYALTQQEGQRVDEIHIWTTAIGAAGVREQLLDRRVGQFYSFCDDYHIPEPVPVPQLHVFRDARGVELDDIRSDEDNAVMLDQLAQFVRREAAVAGTHLLCSAAGGRKTMGIALALALQLYGNPGDRLFHVLVRPAEFEHLPEFFYPPPKPATLVSRDGQRLDTADAVIELAEVPLVLLREHLPEMAAGAVSLSYSQLVHEVQQQLLRQARRPTLEINVARQQVVIDDTVVQLQPLQMALYALLADMRRRCPRRDEHDAPGGSRLGHAAGAALAPNTEEDGCPECTVSSQRLREDDAYAAEIRSRLQRWLDHIERRPERGDTLERWTDTNADVRTSALSQTASKLNTRLRRELGSGGWLDSYLIRSYRQPDTTLYGILLPPRKISPLA